MMRALTLAALIAVATQAPTHAQGTAAVPLGDEHFAMKAYASGIAEVAESQLAYQRATDPGVKAFAEKLVKDHSECNAKIVEMARKKGIALPAAIDAVHSAVIARFGQMSGSDFDKAYLKCQIGMHKEALHLFNHESHKGEDAELKSMAGLTVPKLEEHEKMAFELAGEKAEHQKLCKIRDYAKQVMAEK